MKVLVQRTDHFFEFYFEPRSLHGLLVMMIGSRPIQKSSLCRYEGIFPSPAFLSLTPFFQEGHETLTLLLIPFIVLRNICSGNYCRSNS
jgi:hypothetical protein